MSRREKKNKTNIVGKKKVPYDVIILKGGVEHKYCRVCTKLLLLTDFHKHKQVKNSWKSGHQFECKSCKNTKINPLEKLPIERNVTVIAMIIPKIPKKFPCLDVSGDDSPLRARINKTPETK